MSWARGQPWCGEGRERVGGGLRLPAEGEGWRRTWTGAAGQARGSPCPGGQFSSQKKKLVKKKIGFVGTGTDFVRISHGAACVPAAATEKQAWAAWQLSPLRDPGRPDGPRGPAVRTLWCRGREFCRGSRHKLPPGSSGVFCRPDAVQPRSHWLLCVPHTSLVSKTWWNRLENNSCILDILG